MKYDFVGRFSTFSRRFWRTDKRTCLFLIFLSLLLLSIWKHCKKKNKGRVDKKISSFGSGRLVSSRWSWPLSGPAPTPRCNRNVSGRKGWCFVWKFAGCNVGRGCFFAASRRTESIRWIFSARSRWTSCGTWIQTEIVLHGFLFFSADWFLISRLSYIACDHSTASVEYRYTWGEEGAIAPLEYCLPPLFNVGE